MDTKKTTSQQLTEMNPVYYKGDFTVCGKDWYYDNIALGFNKIYYIVEGECVINIEGITHIAKPGQLFLLPINSIQTLYTTENNYVKKYWFHCILPCQDKDLTELIKLPYYINVKNMAYIERLLKRITKKGETMDLATKFEQKADIIKLLSYYLRVSEIKTIMVYNDYRMDLVISYINENYTSALTLDELSNLLHFHPNYFVRFFKNATGIPPMEYVNNFRIDKAKHMLLDETATIQEVSSSVGFKNTHYFSRFFKKKTRLTPTEYQSLALRNHVFVMQRSPDGK